MNFNSLKTTRRTLSIAFSFCLGAFLISSCSSAQKMTGYKSPKKEEVINEFYRIWDTGDTKSLAKIVARDYKDHHRAIPGSTSDFDYLIGSVTMVTAALTGKHQFNQVHYLPDNRVLVYWTYFGKHTGDFMGISATHKEVAFDGMDIIELNEENKITHHWHIEAVPALMAQITNR